MVALEVGSKRSIRLVSSMLRYFEILERRLSAGRRLVAGHARSCTSSWALRHDMPVREGRHWWGRRARSARGGRTSASGASGGSAACAAEGAPACALGTAPPPAEAASDGRC